MGSYLNRFDTRLGDRLDAELTFHPYVEVKTGLS